MIPALLWRCPLCTTHDALAHRHTFLRPEVVCCTSCGAHWRVRRVPGDDFYLRLDKPSASHPMPAGREEPLVFWYDRMKSGLRLKVLEHPQISLNPGEELYLVSRIVELWLAARDPLVSGPFTQVVQGKTPLKDVGGEEGNYRSTLAGEDLVVLVGQGKVFLTSQRLVWQSETLSQDFPLTHIQGAYAVLTLGLAIASGMSLVFFRFLQESPLKWVSHFGLAAAKVQAETGRRIETSHW